MPVCESSSACPLPLRQLLRACSRNTVLKLNSTPTHAFAKSRLDKIMIAVFLGKSARAQDIAEVVFHDALIVNAAANDSTSSKSKMKKKCAKCPHNLKRSRCKQCIGTQYCLRS